MELLNKIQKELVVNKNHYSDYGKFNYRSCEDILEAVKPLLGTAILMIEDDIVMLGDRYYVKATVTLKDGGAVISVSAFAREMKERIKMDEPQVTGMASSYARKYALCGLFCLHDERDPDTNDGDGTAGPPLPSKKAEKVLRAVCDKLVDSVPEGRTLLDSKVDGVIYAQQGRYPEDINTAGAVAAWLINILNETNKWNTITKASE